MGFGNLGIWEMLVIALIVLVFFGPHRLPEIARSMGKAMREFKRGVNEIQRELEEAQRVTPGGSGGRGSPDARGSAPGKAPVSAREAALRSGSADERGAESAGDGGATPAAGPTAAAGGPSEGPAEERPGPADPEGGGVSDAAPASDRDRADEEPVGGGPPPP